MRPNHVDDLVEDQTYWCISQPNRDGKTYLVNLPWEGLYKEGILIYNNEVSLQPSNVNLFYSKEDAQAAIEYDWNNPPPLVNNKVILSKDTLSKIQEAFNSSKESQSLQDGAVPGLMIVSFDASTQQQLLMALAFSVGMQLVPRMTVDEPLR